MNHQATRQFFARDPRSGAQDGPFAALSAADLAGLAKEARSAGPAWRARDFLGRAAVLSDFAAALETHGDTIAASLERDTGRRRIARLEVDGVIRAIKGWCAQMPPKFDEAWVQGRAVPHLRHRAAFVPYHLIGVISPWNFPLLLSMIDTVPALLSGACVIIKPSEVTPRFIAPLAAAIASVPELSGVLSLACGDGATGAALIGEVDGICFTGSLATGRKVAAMAAERLIPAFLELGGKDPLIVLEGADLNLATDAALRGSVLSTGQACQSIERIYVARAIFAPFVERLVAKAQAVRLNHPKIEVGEIGPIIFARQAEILADQIADARERGAKILTGGVIEDLDGGLYLRPTVIIDVEHRMKVMREETFGPILPVMAFDNVDEAVAMANDSAYGLSAAVIGADADSAIAVALRLEAGAISVQDAALTAMFSEAGKQSFKGSGLGPSRMGADALTRFFRRQALIANDGTPAPIQAFKEDTP